MPGSMLFELPIMRVKTYSITLFALVFIAVSCGGSGSVTLRVFAASSLTEAFKDISLAFEAANSDVIVDLDFSGSQRLRSQVEFGAKADVFASADSFQTDLLLTASLIPRAPTDFASNPLVVIAMANGPVRKISDLAKPGVRVVLGQENVPVGSYSRQVLENVSSDADLGFGGGFKDAVLANLASAEPNVNYVFQKVVLGEVDAGIVYETYIDNDAEIRANGVIFIPIPAAANVSANYSIAVLGDAPEPGLAQEFVGFVLSEAGQRILRDHGFRSP